MTNFFKSPYALSIFVLLASCKTLQPAQLNYHDYQITAQQPKDSALVLAMKPYKDSVDKSMNDVVGYVDETLDKKRPESTLGNFMADAMLYAGKQQFKMPIDAAVVNFGGIRIPQLAKGAVTRGKIFELMPFDNIVVVQSVKGDVLQQFLDLIAAQGGWPIAGVTMQIKDGKAINVSVGGTPLDVNKTYNLVNSDYVANGGDNAAMLKPVPQKNIGYLMRDAIFDYIKALKAAGKNITAKEENRITNAQ